MFRLRAVFAALLLAAFLVYPASSTQAAPTATTDAFVYFSETGHNVGLQIKRFYDANGGIDIFGLPLTELFVEDGLQVQYFERARFELHPELPSSPVLLTRLGAHFTEGRSEPAFQWLAASPGGDRDFFSESGHSLAGAFRWYWQSHGGVSAFGFPISEEFQEASAIDGQTYTVQYFERARFEYHPENVGTPYEVQLSQLGRQYLNGRPDAQSQTASVPPMVLLGASTTVFRTSAAEREFNIARAASMFDGLTVAAGQEYSFLSAGDFSEASGFVEGYGIIGGRMEKVVGGGLCQVSTTMFRAVSNAGLEITKRQGHQYVVYFYENILGFDATVFQPGVDFRWRNNSKSPVVIAASTNPAEATVTFQVWGQSDGRTVSYVGPFTKNVVQPGRATWQYDSTLPRGTTHQLVHGRPGMDVTYTRKITYPDGSVKQNTYYTHYGVWDDFYTYGPGVTPPAGVNVVK